MKKVFNRLNLNKKVIAKLNNNHLNVIRGGRANADNGGQCAASCINTGLSIVNTNIPD